MDTRIYSRNYGRHRSPQSIPTVSRLIRNLNISQRDYQDLQDIMDSYEMSDLGYIMTMLNNNNDNFRISNKNGRESVYVFTKLTLCETHCRLAADGRNRNCNGRCKALHLCRHFLLCSEGECPFNAQTCMFGHDFNSRHNAPLIQKHNLDMLDDDELRRLFRRPDSRSKTTMPQICIYYNAEGAKGCTSKNCKSLHLCNSFLKGFCPRDCPKNHSLGDNKVSKILTLFGIGSSWGDNLILEQLRKLCIDRPHGLGRQAGSSDEDLSSCKGIYYSQAAPSASKWTHLKRKRTCSSGEEEDFRTSSGLACPGCVTLQKEFEELKKEVFSLRIDLQELKHKDEKRQRVDESGNASFEFTLSGNPVCVPAASIVATESPREEAGSVVPTESPREQAGSIVSTEPGSSQVKETREDDEFDID